jgi:O-antigen ligase
LNNLPKEPRDRQPNRVLFAPPITAPDAGRLQRDASSVTGCAFRVTFLAALLLPFSTGTEAGAVVSFGLPFFGLAALMYAARIATKGLAGSRGAYLLGGLYATTMVAFSFLAPDPAQSLARSIPNFVAYVVFVGLINDVRAGRLPAVAIAKLIALSCALLSAYYLLNFVVAVRAHGLADVSASRSVGGLAALPWGASNSVAAVLAIGYACTLYLYQRTQQPLTLLASGLIILGVAATFSRAGVATVAVITGLSVLALSPQVRRWIPVGATVIAVAGFTLYWLVSFEQVFGEIWADRINEESLQSYGGRFDIWRERFEFISESPLTWVGYYGSLASFDGMSAHNFLLTSWLEMGPLGFVTACMLLTWPLLRLVNVWFASGGPIRRGASVLVAGLLGMSLNLMVEDPNYSQPYIFCFWLFLALCIAHSDRTNQRVQTPIRQLTHAGLKQDLSGRVVK